MRTPTSVGARSTSVPPNNARRASGDSSADAALISAVRDGDQNAFGALYERHVASVRHLAYRLCSNSADVDDVVSEVFANTLRALKAGRGPSDDLHSYVLTATRHTVIKFATRADSRHAVATEADQLERPVDSNIVLAGPTGHAFSHLPDRFQSVLWLTCVEGFSPTEVGAQTNIDPSAATSLCMRARRALARSYLISSITQPTAGPHCVSVRELLPCYVLGDSTAGTASRVERHLESCSPCGEAVADMRTHADGLRRMPWAAALLIYIRGWLLRAVAPVAELAGVAAAGTVAVTVAAVLTVTTGDTATGEIAAQSVPTRNPVVAIDLPALNDHDASPPVQPAPAVADSPFEATHELEHTGLSDPAFATAIALPQTALEPITPTPAGVDRALPDTIDPVVQSLLEPSAPGVDPLTNTVVDTAVETVAATGATLTGVVNDTATVVNQLTATATGVVQPVLDGVTEPLVGLPVGTIVAGTLDTTVAATTAAASSTIDSAVNDVVVPVVTGVVGAVQPAPSAGQPQPSAPAGDVVGNLLGGLLGAGNR